MSTASNYTLPDFSKKSDIDDAVSKFLKPDSGISFKTRTDLFLAKGNHDLALSKKEDTTESAKALTKALKAAYEEVIESNTTDLLDEADEEFRG